MVTMQTTPASAEQLDLFHGASISSQLPVVFDTGFKFTEVKGSCASCQQEFGEQRFNGRVTRPTKHVADIFAVGHCEHCNIFTEARLRVYDDYRFAQLRTEGWRTGTMKTDAQRKTGLHHKLGGAIRWLFTF